MSSKESAILVVVDEFFQFIGVNYDVQAAHLSQTEFLVVDARKAHLDT